MSYTPGDGPVADRDRVRAIPNPADERLEEGATGSPPTREHSLPNRLRREVDIASLEEFAVESAL